MKRVLFVSTSTSLGGAEKTLYTLATSLRKRFDVVGVISLKPAGFYGAKIEKAGIPVESLSLGKWPSPSAVGALSQCIARYKPDLVHAFMYQAMQLCRWAKPGRAKSFRLIGSHRVNLRTRSWWTLGIDRLLKSRDDLTIAESEASRRFLIASLGYESNKVSRIYNGVEPGPATDADGKSALKHSLGFSADDLVIGCMGRLDAQKGQDVLIKAMSKIKAKARCAFVGIGPSSHHLQSSAQRLKIQNRVTWLGERSDAAATLAAFDILALPSLWEGLPNIILEAMAAKVPVIASAVDGVPEIIIDGQNGLLVKPGDASDLAEKLDLLCSDLGLRERLARAGQESVLAKFPLDAMLKNYELAYERVLESS